MYVPRIRPNGYILLYSVTFIWLRRILNYQLTQNLGFSMPFHLCIYDQDLEEAFGTLTFGASMYVPLIWANSFFSGIRLPLSESDGYQSIKILILTTSTFIIKTWNKQLVQLATCGANTYVPPIWRNIYCKNRLTAEWLPWLHGLL